MVLTFLGIMMQNQIPSSMQVTGMLLGMVGTIIVSVGDVILKGIISLYKGLKGAIAEESFDSARERFAGDYEKLKD